MTTCALTRNPTLQPRPSRWSPRQGYQRLRGVTGTGAPEDKKLHAKIDGWETQHLAMMEKLGKQGGPGRNAISIIQRTRSFSFRTFMKSAAKATEQLSRFTIQ